MTPWGILSYWDLPSSGPTAFGPEEAKAMTKILDRKICTPCIEKLFDYMYMTWEDASDDDKYLRVFLEMTCSSAPNDDNEDAYCMPVQKLAETDKMQKLLAAGQYIDEWVYNETLYEWELNPKYDAQKVKLKLLFFLHAAVIDAVTELKDVCHSTIN